MQRLKTAIKRHFPVLVPFVQVLRSKVGRHTTESAPKRPMESTTNRLPMSDVFSQVYAANYWGNAESRSGHGSDLKQTAIIRLEIPRLIGDLKLKSMLDIPCGDFFWMRECQLGLETYIGADIVQDMIDQLNERYSNAHRRFELLDLAVDALPKVDLVFCRDLLVHFSSSDIRRALGNLKRSGSTYLLATTFTERDHNMDIPTSGDWRPLNLQLPPISFPEPLRLINEGCTEHFNQFTDKSLGLWRLSDL
jgi:Methyltransferase domain